MPIRLYCLFALAAICCCCTSAPVWYPPPAQRTYTVGSEPRLLAEMIAMNSPYADRHILSGVLGGEPSGLWRWANQRAELRFELAGTEDQTMFVRFVLAEDTFKVTGPVTMQFFLEKTAMGTMRCAKPGEYEFEKAVPSSLLKTGEPVTIAAEADKVWISPDNTKLGFLLVSAGFKE